MNIAVFGGSGFVGKNLMKSRLIDAEIQAISLRDISWKEAAGSADIMINLVGKAHDHKGTASEEEYFFANVELVKKIFDTFIKSDARLLIHVSSIAAVEEFQSEEPLKEESICNPFSLYGKTKRQAEIWLLEQILPKNKKVIILRPPMIHGSGDKGNLGLLYKIISKGLPYPLASFDNSRSFLSVDNFNFFVSEIIKNEDKVESGIYHICDNEPISTKDIINIIKKVTNKKTLSLSVPKIFIQGIAKTGDILSLPINTKRLKKMTSSLLVSNEKIKKVLKIEDLPASSQQGLEKTIKSFS